MDEFVQVTCPFCGEDCDLAIEADVRGAFVHDCEVCCNPWLVTVSGWGDERTVTVARADGSE